jgi:hypothetical protein
MVTLRLLRQRSNPIVLFTGLLLAGACDIRDCASFIGKKKIHATLDILHGGGGTQVSTRHNQPNGPNGTGGDWWQYASKTSTNECNVAAYIRVIPNPNAASLFVGVWAQNDDGGTVDPTYQAWPSVDFCQHSTLSWALYGKSRASGKWQLLFDPAPGGPVWTRIFGTPPASTAGQFCEHNFSNPPTAFLDQGVRLFWIPADWNALYSDFRIVAQNWMHNEHNGPFAGRNCQKRSCYYPIHFFGAI